jgi:hypothetical protein
VGTRLSHPRRGEYIQPVRSLPATVSLVLPLANPRARQEMGKKPESDRYSGLPRKAYPPYT